LLFSAKGYFFWNNLYLYPLITDLIYIFVLFRYVKTKKFKNLISPLASLKGNTYVIIFCLPLTFLNLPVLKMGGAQAILNYTMALSLSSLFAKKKFNLFSIFLILLSVLKVIVSSGKLPLDFLYPLFCFIVSYYHANDYKLEIAKKIRVFLMKLSNGLIQLGRIFSVKVKIINVTAIFITIISISYTITNFINYDWISRFLRQNDVIYLANILLESSILNYQKLSIEAYNYLFSPLTETTTKSYGAFLANQLDPDIIAGGPVVSVFDMIYFLLEGNFLLTILFSLLISLIMINIMHYILVNVKFPRIYLPFFALSIFSFYDYTLFRWNILFLICSIFYFFFKALRDNIDIFLKKAAALIK